MNYTTQFILPCNAIQQQPNFFFFLRDFIFKKTSFENQTNQNCAFDWRKNGVPTRRAFAGHAIPKYAFVTGDKRNHLHSYRDKMLRNYWNTVPR